MVKIPLFLHIDGMVYWNKEVAAATGVDPASWTSIDQMIADFEKVKSQGYVAAAVGGQAFQVGYLFHALLAAVGGPDIYNRMYAEEPDATVFDTPEFAQTVELPPRLRRPGDAREREPSVERDDQHGDHRQGAVPHHGRLDEGRVEGRRQGRPASTSAAP